MTDRTLFQGDSEPARLPGYGVVPGGWARSIVNRVQDRHPSDGRVDRHRRLRQGSPRYLAPSAVYGARNRRPGGHGLAGTAFPRKARADSSRSATNTCRTPYCDAPIRHHDHIVAVAQRRNHEPRELRRTLRSMQSNEGNIRLERNAAAGSPASHRVQHAHRPQLLLNGSPVARHSAVASRSRVPARSIGRCAANPCAPHPVQDYDFAC